MRVACHGVVQGAEERDSLLAVVNSQWYTYGPACQDFEHRLRDYSGKREAVLCNSGSSANLLAVSALTQFDIGGRKIERGDEVITTALNFPTTLNPIIQVGAKPVMVDVTLPGLVPSIDQIAAAVTDKTRAIVLAHTMGMPLPAKEIRELADECGLWFVEDSCDALGTPRVFEYADMSTLSFFPAHQVCAGEGGCVLTDNLKLGRALRSLRDWGRACWCQPGQDNACGNRFGGDYDHKYTYSRIGYHLAMTEFQGALGAAQMRRLPGFITKRSTNHAYLNWLMEQQGLEQFFILPPDVPASWFGYVLICKPPIQIDDIIPYLERRGIQTRRVFGGNLLEQPAYQDIDCRVIGDLPNTNRVHRDAFWVGCWPGLSDAQLRYTVEMIGEYVEELG